MMTALALLFRKRFVWWVGAVCFLLAALGFSRTGSPAQAANLAQAANTGQAVLVCEFETIQPAGAASGGTLPGLGQPQVIYTAAQPVYLSEFTPDGRLLTLQDIPGNQQQVGLLEIPGGHFTPLAERRYTGSLPRWDSTHQVPLYLDWTYTDPKNYLTTNTLRNPTRELAWGSASLSFEVTPTGEVIYFTAPEQAGDLPQLVTTGTAPLPSMAALLPALREPASVVTNAHPAYQDWPSQPFQVALRPGTGQFLLYNQPHTLLANPSGGCTLDLGTHPAMDGDAPLWAVQAHWSPDGRYLAAIATTTLPGQPAGLGAALQSTTLVVLDFTRQVRMEFNLVPEVNGARYVTDLAWSPDGQTLAVLGLVGVNPQGYEELGLFLVNPASRASAHVAQAGTLGGGLWGTQLAWGETGLAATCPLPGVGRVCLLENLPQALYPPTNLPDQPYEIPETSRSASAPDFVIPTDLFIEVYPLTSNGNRREDAGLCTPQSTQWGCTAFCNELISGCAARTTRVVPYPYLQNPLDIPFEIDYLLDVVPQEMGDWYDTGALYAQAVAARTYAYYFVDNPPSLAYNNSISFQAFIPLKFEAVRYYLYPNNFEIWDNACTGDYGDLNPGQKKICDATVNVIYLAYNGASPIVAMFAADAYARTIDNGTTPYLRGVPDPISTACDARDFGHYRGMSQYGAGRWIRAHECSYSGAFIFGDNPPGEAWPVRFSPAQTLTHYYTSVHLYNEFQERLTPNLRWLLLDASWGPAGNSMLTFFSGVPYRAVLQVQNSGTAAWPARSGEGQVALLQRWVTSNNVFYHIVPLPYALNPGQTLFFEIDFPTNALSPGDYEVTFDMGLLTSGGWQHFGDQPALDYDGFEYLMPAVILDAPYRTFLPMVGR